MAVVREDAEADMAATTACEQVSLPHTFTHIHAYTNTHIDTHTEARTHTHTHTKSCAVLVRLLLVSSYTYFILKYDTPG